MFGRMRRMTINQLKIYTPAKDFVESKRFYQALGFELTEAWGGSVDCKLGNAEFRLQNYYAKEWAENFMMQFWVDDVDAWHEHAKSMIESGKFNAGVKAPETVDGSKLFHVWDPCGVLLIFIQ
jgi:catechol 2,3-dioxygenase-like lactoylglutathione lyase family enzyme